MTFVEAGVPAVPRLSVAEVAALVATKQGGIAVCIPARDEAATIGAVVRTVDALRAAGLVDDLLVVDDGSGDATAALARQAGATVVPSVGGPGKGQALTTAVTATDADIVVFLDADVRNISPRYVTDLVAPLLADPALQLVKGTYRRPCDGRADEGGRVTELLARPLLRRFVPELADVGQPLAGECAVRRTVLDEVDLADGYGIEMGLLLDVHRRFGRAAICDVDLGERIHRNRPLAQLRPHADDILTAFFARVS